MDKYDIIVIGAGSGGLNIAGFMNRINLKVLLIDKSDSRIGGDCLNSGCIPSKALIHVSRLVYDSGKLDRYGLGIKGSVNIKKVSDYIKSKQDVIRVHENAEYFRKAGMHVALGEAKFVSKNSVKVGDKTYFGKKIIIATGSRPRKMTAKGDNNLKYGKNYFNNENIFSLGKLPKKIIVIGGGPIGVEIGQALNRLGSKVVILNRGDRFLPKESEEVTDVLLEQLRSEGIDIRFNSSVLKILDKNNVLIKDNKKKVKEKFDAVFVSIGRELNLDLDLENAGIELKEDGRLKLDKYLRTSNKNILACGDAAGGYQFTHAAELHAGVIINNFFSPFRKSINYDNLSWVTYSYPEIATFGINEEEIRSRGIEYEKLETGFEKDDRAIVDDFVKGKLIVYVSKNKLLGGSMVAANAGELFQELILCNSAGLDIKNIFNKIYPYPTATRINKRIIQNHFSKKLTGLSKKLLRFLY